MSRVNHTRRRFLQTIGLGTAAIAAPGYLHASKEQSSAGKRKPNLLFIWTDEQRADTMAVYGNTKIHAPNLNKLAAESVVFEGLCHPAGLHAEPLGGDDGPVASYVRLRPQQHPAAGRGPVPAGDAGRSRLPHGLYGQVAPGRLNLRAARFSGMGLHGGRLQFALQ